jgi:hypothetical protein
MRLLVGAMVSFVVLGSVQAAQEVDFILPGVGVAADIAAGVF